MGFMDAIKSAVNYVTGGAAKIEVQVGSRTADGGFPVHIEAVAPDADLKMQKVYVKVEGHETIRFKDRPHQNQPGQPATSMATNQHEHTETATTFELIIDVAPGTTMAKGQKYQWDTVMRLPADAQPTYNGKNATHEWRVYAALDAAGTDPSSSWVVFRV